MLACTSTISPSPCYLISFFLPPHPTAKGRIPPPLLSAASSSSPFIPKLCFNLLQRNPKEGVRMHRFPILIPDKLRTSFQVVAMVLLLSLLQQNGCWCYQYKVGDLDCWGLPPPSDPLLYSSWSKNHHFSLGDSLLFLYPPSQDSVIQVTERAFNNCGLEDPIMTLRDGNSLFNLSAPGYYYFTSGVAGHCENNQKLAVASPSANGTFFPPAADFATSPTGSQSYPIVFGPASAQGPSTAPAAVVRAPAAMGSVVVAAAAALLLGFSLL